MKRSKEKSNLIKEKRLLWKRIMKINEKLSLRKGYSLEEALNKVYEAKQDGNKGRIGGRIRVPAVLVGMKFKLKQIKQKGSDGK